MRIVSDQMEARVTERREKFITTKNTEIAKALKDGDTKTAKFLTEWRDSYVRASSRVRAGARITQG